MNRLRRLFCAALVMALIASAMSTAFAQTVTMYMHSVDGSTVFSDVLPLGEVSQDSVISAVRSSNKGVMKVHSLIRKVESRYDYETRETVKAYTASLSVRLLKIGRATLKYTLDGVRQSVNYVVRAYDNPVSSLVLSGVGSDNLKSRFDRKIYGAPLVLEQDAKAGWMKVVAAGGWKVRSACWINDQNGRRHGFDTMKQGVTSCLVHVPKMIKGNRYRVQVELENTRTHGVQYLFLNIN